MEDLELDAGSILSAEEADKFFDVQEQDAPEEEEKETKEVIKELPPEKTLDMIAKAWELAGLLVDEKR